MGTIKTTNIEPIADNGTVTLGSSGDTFTLGSGVKQSNMLYPMFAATGASNAISATTYVKAQNGTELFDTDNCYDNSSNYRFTPNVAGKYYLTNRITVSPDSAGSYIFAAIYKNGSRIAELSQRFAGDDISSNYFSLEMSMIAEANGSSDYFEAYVFLRRDGDFMSTSGLNLFSGYRLGS